MTKTAKQIQQYRSREWFSFRKQLLTIAECRCERCGRVGGGAVILQIHHKFYERGKKPWEYSYEQCEVLCKNCHAAEHGLIKPTSNWELVGEDDLGGLDGVCDNCGIEIRYVFFIEHPKWNSMAVGTDCCDFLTGNSEATERRRLVDRKKRFVSSSRWKSLPHRSGAVISQTGIQLEIRKTNEQFQIFVDGISGKQRFSTELEARSTTFDLLSAGTIQDFLNRRKSGGRRN